MSILSATQQLVQPPSHDTVSQYPAGRVLLVSRRCDATALAQHEREPVCFAVRIRPRRHWARLQGNCRQRETLVSSCRVLPARSSRLALSRGHIDFLTVLFEGKCVFVAFVERTVRIIERATALAKPGCAGTWCWRRLALLELFENLDIALRPRR